MMILSSLLELGTIHFHACQGLVPSYPFTGRLKGGQAEARRGRGSYPMVGMYRLSRCQVQSLLEQVLG